MSVINKLGVKSALAISSIGSAIDSRLSAKREGAVAFEYIVILALMLFVIFGAWRVLGDTLSAKMGQIRSSITGINVGRQ